MEGSLPWVNGRQLGQRFRGYVDGLLEHPAPVDDGLARRMAIMVEAPLGVSIDDDEEPERWYLIAVPATPLIEPTEPVQLAEGELFVVADNRLIRFADSGQHIGGRVVQRDWVMGRPLFVLFSVDPKDASIRWERMGLRLR
ncbi:MAG: hypothetical protein RBU37_06235 [Myxococcota bacterium]|jgi:hypothetical protein|nr:hypothetical protein [Myxococcota bacterium]